MIGFYPLGERPLGDISFSPLSSGSFPATVSDAIIDIVYLAEVTSYKGTSILQGAFFPTPLGAAPQGAIGTIASSITENAEITTYYSDRGYTGEPGDTSRANVDYSPRLTQPILISRNISLLPENSNKISLASGNVEINNLDGLLDEIVTSHGIDGRSVIIKVGPSADENGVNSDYSNFATLFDGIGRGFESDLDTVSIIITDKIYKLSIPFQTNRYSGAGSIEGGDDIANKPKPKCYGRVRNISPVLISINNNIFQINDGSIQEIEEVYDRGVGGFINDGDHDTYSSVENATVSTGHFTTSLDLGIFKVGGTPSEPITCDVKGDSVDGYINTHGDIMLRIIKIQGGLSADDLKEETFNTLPTGETGIFISNETTVINVINLLCRSVNAFLSTTIKGRIFASQILNPTGSGKFTLDDINILRLNFESAPIPRQTQRVNYLRNWNTLTGFDVNNSAISDSEKSFMINEWRVISKQGGSNITAKYPFATIPDPLNTFFYSSSAADDLAESILNLYSRERKQFTVDIKTLGYRIEIGTIVRVNYSRYNIFGLFLVIGHEINAEENTVTLRLWG